MTHIDLLKDAWKQCKQREADAVQQRREIEDEILGILAIAPQTEGVVSVGDLKITCRMSRKVDTDYLQDIASEAGLSNFLPHLFRWKADIDTKAWKAASPEVTRILSAAITTTAGRPSFAINETKEK